MGSSLYDNKCTLLPTCLVNVGQHVSGHVLGFSILRWRAIQRNDCHSCYVRVMVYFLLNFLNSEFSQFTFSHLSLCHIVPVPV